jgi:hypothetical protein
MNRKVTKQSTVTPITKSMGSGVANMGKGKSTKTGNKIPLAEKRADKKAMEKAMAIGAAAGAGMPSIASRITKIGTKSPGITKPKAKMLPEVTVTAKKPMLQFARKAKKIK